MNTSVQPACERPPTSDPAVRSTVLLALAEKWEREGAALIERASTAGTWEQDAAWRNSGTAAIRCAKELRGEVSANEKGQR